MWVVTGGFSLLRNGALVCGEPAEGSPFHTTQTSGGLEAKPETTHGKTGKQRCFFRQTEMQMQIEAENRDLIDVVGPRRVCGRP